MGVSGNLGQSMAGIMKLVTTPVWQYPSNATWTEIYSQISPLVERYVSLCTRLELNLWAMKIALSDQAVGGISEEP